MTIVRSGLKSNYIVLLLIVGLIRSVSSGQTSRVVSEQVIADRFLLPLTIDERHDPTGSHAGSIGHVANAASVGTSQRHHPRVCTLAFHDGLRGVDVLRSQRLIIAEVKSFVSIRAFREEFETQSAEEDEISIWIGFRIEKPTTLRNDEFHFGLFLTSLFLRDLCAAVFQGLPGPPEDTL